MSIDIPERLASIAKGLPEMRKQIEEEHRGEMRNGMNHRAYHDLSVPAEALAGDLFDLIGPRCTAFLVFFLAEKMAEIPTAIEDQAGSADWESVMGVAGRRTNAIISKITAPLILEDQA